MGCSGAKEKKGSEDDMRGYDDTPSPIQPQQQAHSNFLSNPIRMHVSLFRITNGRCDNAVAMPYMHRCATVPAYHPMLLGSLIHVLCDKDAEPVAVPSPASMSTRSQNSQSKSPLQNGLSPRSQVASPRVACAQSCCVTSDMNHCRRES